ncbi:hypothetical protein [uncultured Hymenobacter sp.]|uniref:hypothetical protein n=1 Tax=uncultured Hymenobacter sp. TaxID=170016 RepID=UPI0035CC8F55
MAGERYAKLIIHSITPDPTLPDEISIWLAGAYHRFVASAAQSPSGPEEYYCQNNYNTANNSGVRYANAVSLHDAIYARLDTLGVTGKYILGVAADSFTGNGVITIQATRYEAVWNFQDPTSPRMNQVYSFSKEEPVFPIAVSYTTDFVRCFGQATGSIELQPTGGTTYTYAWADGPTSSTRALLVAGRYTVTVTADTGASATETIQVQTNSRIEVLVRKTDTNVVLQVSGGVAPYTFDWDDGATTGTRENLAAGTYYCVVTDGVGCAAVTVEVTIEAYNFYFSRNPILLALDAGDAYRADPATKPTLTFVCDVYLEPDYLSGDFVRVGTTLEQPADRQGRTTFQVEELLDAYLEYHVPAVGQRLISRATPLFRRFYLEHAEVYGTPPVRAAATTLTQHYVTLGGLSSYEAATATYLDRYRPAVKPFLTWQPPLKEVYADQPEFLYYQSDVSASTSIAVRCRVRYNDGTTQLLPLGPLFPAVLRYEVCCVPVGFTQLALTDQATRHVVSWQVWVSDENDAVLSEVRTYVLNRLPTAQRRYFLYANSLGGMDTWCATGEGQLDVEVSGEEVERVAGPSYDVLRGDQLVLERSLRPVLKVASGVRSNSREWMASWQDVLLSRRALLLNEGRWLPGVFKTKTTSLFKEGEWVQVLELDFYLPRERNYTPRLPAEPIQLTRQDLLLP